MHPLTLLTNPSSREDGSVLSLVTDSVAGHIFGGSQAGDIHVWSIHTYFPVTQLIGHQAAVLCLAISVERSLLFSSSGDTTVRLWDSRCLGNALCIIKPPSDSCGDVLSLVWCNQLDTLYLGCQDASIQWIALPPAKVKSAKCESAQPEYHCRSSSNFRPTPSNTYSLLNSQPTTAILRSPSSQSSSTSNDAQSLQAYTSSSPVLNSGRSLHHKFFDSLSQADLLKAARRRDASSHGHSPLLNCVASADGVLESPPRARDCQESSSSAESNFKEDGVDVFFIQNENSVAYAHFGYIYCLTQVYLNERPVLVSGSGDSSIKVWALSDQDGALQLPPKQLTAASNRPTSSLPSQTSEELGAVLTLVARGSTLYSGYQDGLIKIWDLDTNTCIRTLFHRGSHKLSEVSSRGSDDILAMTIMDNGEMFSGCAGGSFERWDTSFQRVLRWKAHQGSALASCYVLHQGKRLFLTGGSDGSIKVWDIDHAPNQPVEVSAPVFESKDQPVMAFQDRMFRHLSQFVAYPSVSNDGHREDCRQAALYLKKTLVKLGADARLLAGEASRNPLVLATFNGKSPGGGPTPVKRKKRVLYYGHYDVVQPGDPKGWKTPAFTMSGKNGWLYGRGVSDNKGPTLAVACAITTLLDQRSLDLDVVMLVEGEAEAGSAGFQVAVEENKELIGDIDVILVSNSSWIGDLTPCVTFGLRGVIHATVKITSAKPDLHSGIHGGAVHEPVLDLIRVLSSLVNSNGQIQLDGFYDGVRPVSPEENELYDQIIHHLEATRAAELVKHSPIRDIRTNLLTKWRKPALSVHKVDVTGPAHATVIPSFAEASVSIRIVPDQALDQISNSLLEFLKECFDSLNSTNTLEVKVNQATDWWLGEPKSLYSQAIAESIEEEWGIKPLWVREGGSIPSIPFLERRLNAKAVHLPMGSSPDAAHLPNERIRMVNLEKGSNVVAKFLKKVAHKV